MGIFKLLSSVVMGLLFVGTVHATSSFASLKARADSAIVLIASHDHNTREIGRERIGAVITELSELLGSSDHYTRELARELLYDVGAQLKQMD